MHTDAMETGGMPDMETTIEHDIDSEEDVIEHKSGKMYAKKIQKAEDRLLQKWVSLLIQAAPMLMGSAKVAEEKTKTDEYNRLYNKLKKGIDNPFAVATAQAKKMGYSDFTEGSGGDKKRDEIAEALKRKES